MKDDPRSKKQKGSTNKEDKEVFNKVLEELKNKVVLEKTLESPLDCKEIQPVYSKGDQPWVFIERTDAEAETPILCLLYGKS